MRRCKQKKEGAWLVSIDFGQIEARVLCMFSRDKVYSQALFDDYDVHLFWAEQVVNAYPQVVGLSRRGSWKALDDKGRKKFRSKIKNSLVFPWFYLASSKSVAKALGIPDKVMQELYSEFWGYFAGVKQWQEGVISKYQKEGYVETLTGRRRYYPLNYTKLANTPVQGTASDIVVGAGNRLARMAYERDKPQLNFRLNIHDDLTFVLPDKTLEEDIEMIVEVMVDPSPYEWCNVPLTAEVAVGRNWYNQDPVHTFDSRDFYHFGGWPKKGVEHE